MRHRARKVVGAYSAATGRQSIPGDCHEIRAGRLPAETLARPVARSSYVEPMGQAGPVQPFQCALDVDAGICR